MEQRKTENLVIEHAPPDVLRVTWKGDFDITDLEAMVEYTADIKRRHGREEVKLLVCVHDATSLRANTRKRIAEIAKARLWSATAVVGAEFKIRVVIELIVNATRLVRPDAAETRFFDTEPEARAWLGVPVRAEATI